LLAYEFIDNKSKIKLFCLADLKLYSIKNKILIRMK